MLQVNPSLLPTFLLCIFVTLFLAIPGFLTWNTPIHIKFYYCVVRMTFIFYLFIFECEIGEISFLGEGTEDLKKIIEKKQLLELSDSWLIGKMSINLGLVFIWNSLDLCLLSWVSIGFTILHWLSIFSPVLFFLFYYILKLRYSLHTGKSKSLKRYSLMLSAYVHTCVTADKIKTQKTFPAT